MPIPETQLDTWAHHGAIATSRDTYATVKRALEASNTAYASKGFEVFLQGSYCNDTNVYAESDVDVVICLNDIYYYDTSGLNAAHLATFNSSFVAATYTYADFKTDVTAALRSSFGSDVAPGTKAIKIRPSPPHRSADVVVAAQFKSYYSDLIGTGSHIVPGICFFAPDGTRIVNYPKQHSANCTAKHQATNSWFKPSVRIMKNMRNRLVENNVIRCGLAPSYFIEGLMHNVPNDKFSCSYDETIVASFNWVRSLDRNALNRLFCANGRHLLFAENSPTSWPYGDFDQFFNAVADLWRSW